MLWGTETDSDQSILPTGPTGSGGWKDGMSDSFKLLGGARFVQLAMMEVAAGGYLGLLMRLRRALTHIFLGEASRTKK